MIRVVLINLLLFLLPFVIYAAYVYVVQENTDPQSIWKEAPINWLLIAGAVLVLGTLLSLVSFSGSNVTGTYKRPVLIDGKLEPGRIEE